MYNKEFVTLRTKQTFEENHEASNDWKVAVERSRCTAMTALNSLSSWHLFKNKIIPTDYHRTLRFCTKSSVLSIYSKVILRQ